ncbi:hypothetical protein KIPB_001190 [Kipferlia bialata]|uniref:Uncharacterized protein n=1 Tax=Kipferlia bialata TaxID=797122 RepID=A0A9K3GFP9_9EUKA|nr:hypothetical protein KIPB_001190 [Kipferlia bialata]|eukprot:g1190.t1
MYPYFQVPPLTDEEIRQLKKISEMTPDEKTAITQKVSEAGGLAHTPMGHQDSTGVATPTTETHTLPPSAHADPPPHAANTHAALSLPVQARHPATVPAAVLVTVLLACHTCHTRACLWVYHVVDTTTLSLAPEVCVGLEPCPATEPTLT